MECIKTEIKNGVDLHTIKTSKFKTNLIAVMLTNKITKENATKNALLSLILRRGTANIKTQDEISKKLENMYGANFDCGIDKIGDNQVIKFYLESLNNEYLPVEEDNLKESIEILLDIVCNPLVEENKFKQDQCFKYHYQLLNKKQKQLYQIIYNIAYTRKQNIYIKEKEIDKVSKIVNAVLKDHPELFYIKEWSLNTKGLFNFEYSMKEKEILKDQKRIKKIVKQLKEDTQNLKSYQKIKYIYDDVITHCKYNEQAKYNQEIISVLINHQSVCSGYAKTMQYLLNQLHFKATFLTGKTIKGRRDKHAINMIKYDNDYYYIDATWGDLVLADEEIINNNYLMFDSQTMKQMYDLDDHYKITKNDKHTYFKEEGLYFDLYQLNTLKAKINKNQRECYLQFSNEVYNDAKERLTKKGDAYRLIEGVDHIQYITNDQLKTIYLKW